MSTTSVSDTIHTFIAATIKLLWGCLTMFSFMIWIQLRPSIYMIEMIGEMILLPFREPLVCLVLTSALTVLTIIVPFEVVNEYLMVACRALAAAGGIVMLFGGYLSMYFALEGR